MDAEHAVAHVNLNPHRLARDRHGHRIAVLAVFAFERRMSGFRQAIDEVAVVVVPLPLGCQNDPWSGAGHAQWSLWPRQRPDHRRPRPPPTERQLLPLVMFPPVHPHRWVPSGLRRTFSLSACGL